MEKGLSTTKLPYEAGKRPKRAKRSGSGNHCQTAKAHNTMWIIRPRLKQILSFFHFPKTPKRKMGWLQNISRFRQREGKDKFNVNNALMRQFHFESGGINVSMGQGNRTLKRNMVATLTAKGNPLRPENHCLRKLENLSRNKLTTKLKKHERLLR